MIYSLLSSPDEEWSDEDEFVIENLLFFNVKKKPRVGNFVEDVIDKYTDIEFKENLRVSRETSNFLISKYENSEFNKRRIAGTGGRKEIPAKTQMLSFLWFAGKKTTYREVANLFNISISSMQRCLMQHLDFFFDISTTYIKFPTTEEEKKNTADKFFKLSKFPNVLGCIDGTYINIRKPAHKIKSTYVNRHDIMSITLQGICDSERRFTDVFVGCSSKIHDARIFDLSFISKKLPGICGEEYHILGDAAYPLREYLLTPFKDYGNLTQRELKYNLTHCQTRVKIENTFGLLKQRFRQLIRLDFFEVESMANFVLACCVLHNMCINNNDNVDIANSSLDLEETINIGEAATTSGENARESALRRLGEIKRNNIKNSL